MTTYVIAYEDFKYGTCCCKYEATDILNAIDQFKWDGNDLEDIISITVGR